MATVWDCSVTTTTATSSAPVLLRPAPATTPAGPGTPCVDSVASLAGGRIWRHRPGYERLLAEVPGEAWTDPGAQGWQCVKQNSRREVWRARLRGGVYYLKYFDQRNRWGGLERWLRRPACVVEWDGGLYALRHGIAAALPVAYTLDVRRGGRRWAVLVTEALEPALPLHEFWQQLRGDDDPRRRAADTAQLIEQLAELIARAHQAGFEHLDMHAANLLVQTVAPRCYRPVFVDLQSARRGVPLSDAAVVRNLAQLNQWFRRHATIGDRLRFLRAYLRWRHEFEVLSPHGRPLGVDFRALVQRLARQAARHADHLGAQRDRRSRRDGRYFARLRLPGGWRGVAMTRCKHASAESKASQLELRPDTWARVLRDPLRLLAPGGGRTCKDSHSATVCRTVLELDGTALGVIIKRPRARTLWRRLVQLWPPSRSARGWRIGHALLHRDVATARPLVLLERRVGPFVADSLLITEALPNAIDMESLLRRPPEPLASPGGRALKQRLSALLVPHLRRLLDRGFIHRDCKASNVLVVPEPALKLLWIDLDGIRRARPWTRDGTVRALTRLHVSLLDVPGLTRTDRLRFLRAFTARFGAPVDAWRSLWRAVAAAAARKLRQQRRRRAWKVRHYGRA